MKKENFILKKLLKVFKPAVLIATLSFMSCGPAVDLRSFADKDLFPPVIKNILPLNEYAIKLEFNEAVKLKGNIMLSPELGALTSKSDKNRLIINCSKKQQAGVNYTVDATVMDKNGNSMSFIISFYGFNPDMPNLIINEFTTQGSKSHPDIVELYVTEAGNAAGLWIIEGTTDFPEEGICLPPFRVEEGDYILIHFKPQGITEEIDEYGTEINISGGHDASDEARDFWVPGGNGLSGNNGVISVYEAPGGRLIDAVLYSNRTSSSDEKYSGFGSLRMLNKTRQLKEQEGWFGTGDEGRLRPEDAVNPDDSTATRSICRGSNPMDTDTAADWHIVPTSSSTFGSQNTDEVFE